MDMTGDRYLITDQNAIYFLTFTVIDWVDIFSRKEYKLEIINSINYCINEKGLTVFAWVIMSNHIHFIWQAKQGYQLSSIIRDFKSFTAKRILEMIEHGKESRKKWLLKKFEFAGKRTASKSNYKFWKNGNHAICLSELDQSMMQQKLDYIHDNPVKAMIVANPEDYIFSSAIVYSGEIGLVPVTIMH